MVWRRNNVSKPWIFMGVDRSHFSGKLRPALRYKQIHYVEYAPDMEEIMRRTGVGFVPVVCLLLAAHAMRRNNVSVGALLVATGVIFWSVLASMA